MLALTMGLLLPIAIAVGVVLLVAVPHLRSGSRILTPDGERQVRAAKERSAAAAVTAGQTVARGASAAVSGIGSGIGRAIDSPAIRPRRRSVFGRDRQQPEQPAAAAAPRDVTAELWSPVNRGAPSAPTLVVPDSSAGSSAPSVVSRPRPHPADSAPIPEVAEQRSGQGGRTDVIDLRGSRAHPGEAEPGEAHARQQVAGRGPGH